MVNPSLKLQIVATAVLVCRGLDRGWRLRWKSEDWDSSLRSSQVAMRGTAFALLHWLNFSALDVAV